MFFAPEPIKYAPGIHPSAVVSEKAQIMENVHIGANAVIEEGVIIGRNSIICAGVFIGHFTKIGENTLIYPNACVRERCIIGNRVIIHPNATVGSDGFGFAPGPKGIVKIPQTGIVQIDDDVEIGSNTTIDRARFGKTWLKQGVKVDNLVQIAHNVIIGEFSMLISQSGVAGSSELGRGVIVAAKGGINGHITIGDGAKVAGTSGVIKSLPAGAEAVGTPAEPPRDFMERLCLPKKVKKMSGRIDELENQILQLKAKLDPN
jgi:UDP-3-O-[3-hydroxymyristoyl] glucosamine N-acyltransferase